MNEITVKLEKITKMKEELKELDIRIFEDEKNVFFRKIEYLTLIFSFSFILIWGAKIIFNFQVVEAPIFYPVYFSIVIAPIFMIITYISSMIAENEDYKKKAIEYLSMFVSAIVSFVLIFIIIKDQPVVFNLLDHILNNFVFPLSFFSIFLFSFLYVRKITNMKKIKQKMGKVSNVEKFKLINKELKKTEKELESDTYNIIDFLKIKRNPNHSKIKIEVLDEIINLKIKNSEYDTIEDYLIETHEVSNFEIRND